MHSSIGPCLSRTKASSRHRKLRAVSLIMMVSIVCPLCAMSHTRWMPQHVRPRRVCAIFVFRHRARGARPGPVMMEFVHPRIPLAWEYIEYSCGLNTCDYGTCQRSYALVQLCSYRDDEWCWLVSRGILSVLSCAIVHKNQTHSMSAHQSK